MRGAFKFRDLTYAAFMNNDMVARKERWARKMAGKEKPIVRSTDRLPPGQHEVKDWPVLDLGSRPEVPLEKWQLKISGLVDSPMTLNWSQFMALPQFTDTSDFHCVTTWSQFDLTLTGVAFFTVAELVKPRSTASALYLKSYDGYTTNVALDACMDDDVMIAHAWNGRPLPVEHGGPARLIVPKLYAWKGAKWLKEIIFMDRHLPGFWELRGYSDTADPWRDDRFR